MTTQRDDAPTSVVFPGDFWRAATPESQGMAGDRVEEAARTVDEMSGEQGADEMLIVRNGYIVWQGDDVGRQHLVWSCTKSFLSTCFGLLWDDGKIEPDMLAKEVIPELAEPYPDMTLEHLGTLTSGYDFGDDPLDPAPPMFPPGEGFHYSAQSDLLAAILTRIEGRSLEELFLERVGKPIGITRDAMEWQVWTEIDGIPLNGGSGRPGGGVHITGPAMARFGWFYTNEGIWGGERLISRRYVDYATVARTSPDLPAHDPEGWYTHLPGNYGLNWWTNGITPEGKRLWPDAPKRTFEAQGNNNNNCFVVPNWRMTIVRLGTDEIIEMGLYNEVFRLLGESLEKGGGRP